MTCLIIRDVTMRVFDMLCKNYLLQKSMQLKRQPCFYTMIGYYRNPNDKRDCQANKKKTYQYEKVTL